MQLVRRFESFERGRFGGRQCFNGCGVACDGSGGASLSINGIERQSVKGDPTATLHLSSTVQTDYEWHEFIEGIVRPGADGVEAVLLANKAEIAREAFAQNG